MVAAVTPSGAQKVAVDFQQVTYIASPGIRLLLEIADRMQPVCAGCHHTFWYPLQSH